MILIFEGTESGGGLARVLCELGETVTVDRTTDVSSMRSVRQRALEVQPRAIVFNQSWDDRAGAEADPDRAFRLNAENLIHVTAAALETTAVPVLISTAEVFGQAGGPFDEGDTPVPLGVWAESRLLGERYFLRAAKNSVVIRVGPVLDDGLVAFKSVLAKGPVEGAKDQRISPVDVEDLGHALFGILTQGGRGVFHVATTEPAPTHREVWSAVAEALGIGPSLVLEAAASKLKVPTARSPTLIFEKARSYTDRPPRPWREAVTRAASQGSRSSAATAPVTEARMGHKQEVRRVDKPWGHEIIWAHSERYVGKVLFVRAGERLSLQYHQQKDETVYVLSGKMLFEVGPKDQPREDLIMKPGDSYRITPLTVHRMIAIEDTTILEASTPELDDVVRLEDRYGRAGTSNP